MYSHSCSSFTLECFTRTFVLRSKSVATSCGYLNVSLKDTGQRLTIIYRYSDSYNSTAYNIN